MNLLHLAWLNMWRNKRRTGITLASVAFGFWLAAAFIGTREHTYTRLVDQAARLGSGHISIMSQHGLNSPGPAFALSGMNRDLMASLLRLPDVAGVYPRLIGNGIVGNAEKSSGVTYIAIDPASELAEHNIFLTGLADPSSVLRDNKVALGSGLAVRLGAKKDDRLVLTLTDRTGAVSSHLAIVGGMFTSGNEDADQVVLLARRDFLQPLLQLGPDEVTVVAVYAKAFHQIDRLHVAIKHQLENPPQVVVDWKRTHRDLAQFIRYDSAVYRILIFFIGVIIAAGILNTLVLALIERRREFGVMTALGIAPTRMFGLIVCEGVLIGVIGLICGGLSFYPVYLYLNQYGLDLTGLLSETINAGGISIPFVMYCELSLSHLGAIGGVVLALTVVASLFPAWKAARTMPVRSLS